MFSFPIQHLFPVEVLNVVFTLTCRARDYMMLPKHHWDYALYLPDDSHAEKYLNVTYTGVKSGVTPFSLQDSPLKMTAQVRL